MVEPGHAGAWQTHDAYAELAGPSATDVHHNFVQRWNEASERGDPGGIWGHDGDDELSFPVGLSRNQGDSVVQVQRTIHSARYLCGHPSPGGKRYDIANGERTILEQYRLAIRSARRSIYIENQAIGALEIVHDLDKALASGVSVVLLFPATNEAAVHETRGQSEYRALFPGLRSEEGRVG